MSKPGDYYVRFDDPTNHRLKFLKGQSKESASQFLARQIDIAWKGREIGCCRAGIDAARQQYINDNGRAPEDPA